MSPFFPAYFSEEELSLLRLLEGRALEQVLYTVWTNTSPQGEGFRALDWLSLRFRDGLQADFHADPETEGIRIEPLDFGAEEARVRAEFRGQAALERVDMGASPVWAGLIGQKLRAVGLEEVELGCFNRLGLHLDFGRVTVEVLRDEEGLLLRRL
jgi:hypothetical protein